MDQKTWERYKATYETKRCSECPYGKEVTDQGKHWGWACHHPDIISRRGLMYGRYHQIESKNQDGAQYKNEYEAKEIWFMRNLRVIIEDCKLNK